MRMRATSSSDTYPSVIVFILALIGLVVLPRFIFPSREDDVIRVEVIADIKHTRQEVAHDFVIAVVSCISPQIVPVLILTEQQLDQRIMAAIATCYPPKEPKENSENPNWTWEFPCKIKINRSRRVLGGEVKFGDIEICKTAIVTGISVAAYRCWNSLNYITCLTSSVLTTEDVNKEIDKPVNFEYISYK
jgi:hypothetical protein